MPGQVAADYWTNDGHLKRPVAVALMAILETVPAAGSQTRTEACTQEVELVALEKELVRFPGG